ncbi:hypothetical protein [Campylobacter sp. RM16188]|uniref:hypothetical protein n=1 Tax=Campylobacter sp. RM16188 TaxID=1705725 RepID=UPI001551C179|nr:hypothetical protein [Campylobacter sp. RM16188]
MNSISIIDAPILFTAVIAGLASMIIFIYPIISYVREFNSKQQTGKSYIEIFAKTFGLQFAILLFILAFAFLWNTAVGDHPRVRSYSMKYGTALFYGHFNPNNGSFTIPATEDGKGFWTVWRDLGAKGVTTINSITSNTMNAGAAKAIGGAIVVIGMMTMVIWLALLIYPPFCILAPVFMVIRREQQQQHTDDTFDRLYKGLILSLTLVVFGYIHSSIASVFVSAQLGVDFSFWKNMESIWSGIFMGV